MNDMQKIMISSTALSEWWRGAVIYQIYPRSFADSNGDGVGDLPGVTGKLDYVASLGVDAIWLSPFFTSPMRDFGYDVADYCGVDPIFGTLDDFDALIAKAHGLGLKVIIDQVYSHTSDQHPWFAESRSSRDNAKADWYVWADPKPDGSPPNNWQSVFGGPAWTWDARRGQYYMHNFLREQPQMNGHNPEVQEALLGVAKFWLDGESTVSALMRSTLPCMICNCGITRPHHWAMACAPARSISSSKSTTNRIPIFRVSSNAFARLLIAIPIVSPLLKSAGRSPTRK